MAPTWQALIDGARYCEPQLRDILARQAPDVIVEDNVVCFPALVTHGAPFVRIVSCNPLEMPGPDIAPAYSGLPADGPVRVGGLPGRATTGRIEPIWTAFDAWVREQGAPRLPGPRVHPCVRAPQHVRLPGSARLHRRPTARRDVAPPGVVGAHHGRALRAARGSCATARRTARSSISRWGRWGRRTWT